MIDVSVIIVNYNTPNLVIDCIHSIKRFTKNISYEIIVIDNNSNDNSEQILKEIFKDIIYIKLEDNLGFSKANNIASNFSNGEFLFFLNSDTILLNNAIFYFLEFYKNNTDKNIGALGSILLNRDFDYIHSGGNFLRMKNVILNQFFSYLKINNDSRYTSKYFKQHILKNRYIKLDYITGANLFIKKNIFINVNGFNEIFFMYCEDMDLCKRLNLLGYSSYIINDPRIIHLEGGSNDFSLISYQKRIMHAKSMLQYFYLHNTFARYYFFKYLYFFIRIPIIFDIRISFTHRIKYLNFLLKYN